MERKELCPGSDAMEDRVSIPRLDTEYSIEGTRAHIVVDYALKNGIRSAKEAHAETILFDMEFKPDFFRAVQMMLNYVYGIMDQYPDAVLSTEQQVFPPTDVVPLDQVSGYCDVAIFIPSIRKLYVIDYKHGAGVAKDISRGGGSPQPWQYAAGLIYDATKPAVDPAGVDTVILAIIQPRAFHILGPIRELEVTAYEVFEYLDRMDRAILRARDPNAPLIPGNTQCMFCPAKVECPARQAKAFAAVTPPNTMFKGVMDVMTPKIPNPVDMTVEQIAYASQMLPFLKSWIKDFEERRLEILRLGNDIPGLKVVETYARTEWFGDAKDIGPRLAALIGCDVEDVMQYVLIPPSEAKELVIEKFKSLAGYGRKKLAAEEGAKALAFLTTKNSTGNLTVVPDTDSRAAVVRGPAMFAQLGQLPTPGDDT